MATLAGTASDIWYQNDLSKHMFLYVHTSLHAPRRVQEEEERTSSGARTT